MRHVAGIILASVIVWSSVRTIAAPPATQPTTAPAIDPALLKKLTQIDARAARITSLLADFEQRKFTALLRKPLVSTGRVRVKGSTMRWDTERPEKNVLLVSEKDVQVYYPGQATVEIFTIDQRLAELAASPLPRLSVLKERFSFEEIPVAEMNLAVDSGKFLALKLTPAQDELRQHVQEVRVLLDMADGYIVEAELTDADGDRTAIIFRNVQVNAAVGDLELKLPQGTKVSRPLEGLQGAEPSRSK